MFLFMITYCVILVYIITKSKLFMKYIQFSIFSNGAELLYVKKKYSVFCFDYGVIVHGFFKFTIFFIMFFNYFGWRKYDFCGMTVWVLFWLLILFMGLNCNAVFYVYCWWCSGLLTVVGDSDKECLYTRVIVSSMLFWLLILLCPNISRIVVSLCPMSYCVHAS